MKKTYFQFVSAAHLFLVKDEKILLLRRFNTGYEDGNYSVPAGHLDGNERVTQTMIREAKEEAGIDIDEKDLRFVHVMHRTSLDTHPSGNDERIDWFFQAKNWRGEPKIMESDKCDDLSWFPLDNLPSNTIPYVRAAIENYRRGIPFSEFGWEIAK